MTAPRAEVQLQELAVVGPAVAGVGLVLLVVAVVADVGVPVRIVVAGAGAEDDLVHAAQRPRQSPRQSEGALGPGSPCRPPHRHEAARGNGQYAHLPVPDSACGTHENTRGVKRQNAKALLCHHWTLANCGLVGPLSLRERVRVRARCPPNSELILGQPLTPANICRAGQATLTTPALYHTSPLPASLACQRGAECAVRKLLCRKGCERH